MTPRVGFVGVGWIGLDRMRALVADGGIEAVAVVDPDPAACARALELAPRARVVDDYDTLLDERLDAVVIATPSALHASQTLAALDRGLAVFCQKPLGRTGAEVREILSAARRADRLLGVDLSYRGTAAFRAAREQVASGRLGRIYAADLVFHNAYGPDKPWFRDPSQSGGGAVIDLGIHLVDGALWSLGFPRVLDVRSTLWARGRRLDPAPDVNEDHAVAELHLEGGAVARLACSWFLPAGRDAVIEASFWGTAGGVSVRNVDGSFYDFVAERHEGTRSVRLVEPPDAWGGRAAVAWARRLADSPRYDPEADRLADVAEVLDAIYGR